MAKSRLDMRREVEAAEALEKASPKKKRASSKSGEEKGATKKKKATRKKAASRSRKAKDTPARRRLVWVIYSSTMREEGRFLYHERDKAEEKLEQLLSKGKRRYFIQPIKEPLDSEGQPMVPEEDATKSSASTKAKAKAAAEEDAGDDDGDEGDDTPAEAATATDDEEE